MVDRDTISQDIPEIPFVASSPYPFNTHFELLDIGLHINPRAHHGLEKLQDPPLILDHVSEETVYAMFVLFLSQRNRERTDLTLFSQY